MFPFIYNFFCTDTTLSEAPAWTEFMWTHTDTQTAGEGRETQSWELQPIAKRIACVELWIKEQ